MELHVQKYGGSSVADVDKIKNVARRIVETADQGNQVVAVVSALGDTTDELIELAEEVSNIRPKREMDLLMSTGEVISSALLAMAVADEGKDARALIAHQLGIKTDFTHTKARILNIDDQRLRQELEAGNIVIAAGFQGITEEEDVTTLGRGGSDTTAVALAAALDADECEIYTDVDGVFTANPQVVKGAHKIDRISPEEMLELASLGAEVLQVRAVEFAWKYNVKLHVRSSFNDQIGTIITGSDEDMEDVEVRAVTSDDDQTRFTVLDVPDKPGMAGKIFGALADADINVDMIVQSSPVHKEGANDISFTVSRTDSAEALEILDELVETGCGSELTTDDAISKVSVVGSGMRNHPGVAQKLFNALGGAGINIETISTSEIKISVLVSEKQSDEAVQILHDVYEL